MVDDNPNQIFDSIIVGAGLAGLSCANHLHKNGFSFLLLESSDGIGGRVRSDRLDGFVLDRGFQVFLTSYPEAARFLDYKKLDLKPFYAGALIAESDRFIRVSDPFKDPSAILSAVFSDISSLSDKMRIAYLRQKVMASTVEEIFAQPDKTILEALQVNYGFSATIIDRFFKPFFGGITLDKTLSGSSRMFEFVYKMMAEGLVTIPAHGMDQIPAQLAERLPENAIRLNSRVASLSVDGPMSQVTLASGQVFTTRSIVLATNGLDAHALCRQVPEPCSQMATCLYFASPSAPIKEPLLVLDGSGLSGPVNNLAVLSNVSPAYAPEGQHLISATVVGGPSSGNSVNGEAGTASDLHQLEFGGAEEAKLIDEVKSQMESWFGKSAVAQWRHLRTYRIAHGQPNQSPPWLEPPSRPLKIALDQSGGNVYVCGDHRENASINGAMRSGRLTGEALLADLQVATVS